MSIAARMLPESFLPCMLPWPLKSVGSIIRWCCSEADICLLLQSCGCGPSRQLAARHATQQHRRLQQVSPLLCNSRIYLRTATCPSQAGDTLDSILCPCH